MAGVLLALAVIAIPVWLLLKALGIVKTAPDYRNPKVVITFGLATLNLVAWATIPWVWGILTYTWHTWIFFNVGLWVTLYLTSRETPSPMTIKIAGLISIALVVGFITTAILDLRRGDLSPEAWERKQAEEKLRERMFQDIPVLRAVYAHNKPDKKFWVTEKKVGEKTEKEIEAEKIYKEKGLFFSWGNTMGRWEKSITQEMLPFTLAIVEVPAGDWSKSVKIPAIRGGAFADWPDAPEECELMADDSEEDVYPCVGTSFEEPVYEYKFRSKGRPFKLEVVIRK